jgi:putative FmdB family regulatory protein
MPLYEYDCRGCGLRFEALVRGTATPVTPVCPACQGADLERVLSVFGVGSDATRQANLKAGRKHQAKALRDKTIADHEAAHHHHH